jgi:hypothetical protein
MSGLRSIGDVLGGVGSLSGLGGAAGGAAGAAGGLAGLGFGPLAALTAIPAGLQLIGSAFGASRQEKARAEAAKVQVGLNLFAPEAELARQGFGKAFDYELGATSPFVARERARSLSDRIFLQEEPAKAGYMASLAGRYRGVV